MIDRHRMIGADVRALGEDGEMGDASTGSEHRVLDRFTPATQDWFRGAFSAPTPAQAGAWEAISAGKHALVVAPTGSGKTLSAFLWAIDSVFREGTLRQAQGPSGEQGPSEEQGTSGAKGPSGAKGTSGAKKDASRTRILYISPLKALGVDVERNLRSPLIGIG